MHLLGTPSHRSAQPRARIGGDIPAGSGSDAPRHAHPLHSTFEGAHRARSWLPTVARRSILGRPHQIKASQERTCGPENQVCITRSCPLTSRNECSESEEKRPTRSKRGDALIPRATNNSKLNQRRQHGFET